MATKQWALILGASSGFGEAASVAFAKAGYGVFAVHLDRRGTLPHVEEIQKKIQATGQPSVFFNVNAAEAAKRSEVVQGIQQRLKQDNGGQVTVLMHSLAFGTLKPYLGSTEEAVSQSQMEMTLDVMANSLVYWVQDVVRAGVMGENGRVYAMTSAGSGRIMPAYGPVSAAKSALESHIRQLAVELAPRKITANAIRAGVTDTPSLRKIPGSDQLIERGLRDNPYKRLTTPEDVAQFMVAFSDPRTYWCTGNVLNVDGGEYIV